MPDNLLGQLPADMKLHLFSFLAIKDTVSVLSANKTNHLLDEDSDFWRYKIRQDFYMSVPDQAEPKEFYQTLHKRLGFERDICLAYLHSLQNDELLIDYHYELFMTATTSILANNEIELDQVVEYLPICGAHLTLHIFLSQLSFEQKQLWLNKNGSHYLCNAVKSFSVECVEELTRFGVNVNQPGYGSTIVDTEIYRSPLAAALFHMKDKMPSYCDDAMIDNFKQIIELLLSHGADPDVPGLYKRNDEAAVLSMGYSAINDAYDIKLRMNADNYPSSNEDQRDRVLQIVQSVINASSLEKAYQQQNATRLNM